MTRSIILTRPICNKHRSQDELQQQLTEVTQVLEEEVKARSDLEVSKRILVGEEEELRQMLGQVEESKTQLEKETQFAQEVDIWKAKLEQEARLRLQVERVKSKLEEEAEEVRRKLEDETQIRMQLENKLTVMEKHLRGRTDK